MKKESDNRIIYSINVADIQQVARETLHRRLTKKEIALVEDEVGKYVRWYDAIELSIWDKITSRLSRAVMTKSKPL